MYYIPTIKNPLNLSIITRELIHSPHVFPFPDSSSSDSVDLFVVSFLVEGFEAAATRKASITDPTVTPQDWTNNIYKAVGNLKPEHQWRALPPLAGLIKAIYYQKLRLETQSQQKGRNRRDVGILADTSLVHDIQKSFISIINKTFEIYGNIFDSQFFENELQIPVVIYTLSVTLQFLSNSLKKKINYTLVLPYSVSFVYFSQKGLYGGKLLRTLTDKNNQSIAISLDRNPVFTKLSSLSILIQTAVQEINSANAFVACKALDVIYQFSHSLADEWQNSVSKQADNIFQADSTSWEFLKVCLFSVSLALEGYTKWILASVNKTEYYKNSINISSTIVQIFSNMYFIVAQISLTGFPTFDFVYFSAIDILLDPQFHYQEFSNIISRISVPILSMSNQQRNKMISNNLVYRGKVIYLLNLCEVLTPFLPTTTFPNKQVPLITLAGDIIPLTKKFLYPPPVSPDTPNLTLTYFQPILESAHSVMLAVITTPSQVYERINGNEITGILPTFLSFSKYESDDANTLTSLPQLVQKIIPEYFKTVNDLFVGVLSFHQFTLAITTLVKAVSPPSPIFSLDPQRAGWMIDFLIERSDEVGAGISLPTELGALRLHETGDKADTNQKSISSGLQAPPTIRAVILGSVIHALPYLDAQVLEKYLSLIWKRIDQTTKFSSIYSSSITQEQNYLEIDMFNMISRELDQQKATVGIKWWYQKSML